MNKTIRNLAVVAVFCFAGAPGLLQEVNETAATETIQPAQEAGGNVNHLPRTRYWP